MSPMLLPELVTVALPPFCVVALTAPLFVPELFTVALPPPVVSESKPLALPELLTVSFWFAPVAALTKGTVCVPELVQVTPAGVLGHGVTDCATAGEFVKSVFG
jgi:hypothetical protein